MSAIANALRPVAASLMSAQFADPVTVTYVTEGTFDPATGRTGTRTTSIATVNGLLEEFSSLDILAGQGQEDGVQSGDQKLTVAASALATKPTTDDSVETDGDTWQIRKVDEVPAGPTPVLYVLRLRR